MGGLIRHPCRISGHFEELSAIKLADSQLQMLLGELINVAMRKETLDMQRFEELGIIKNPLQFQQPLLELFTDSIQSMKQSRCWNKPQLVSLFQTMLPEFGHKETGKSLDEKM